MRFYFPLILLLLGWQVQSALAASNVDVFGQLPFVKSIQLSPDGTRIAYMQAIDDKYFLVTKVIADNQSKPTVFGLDTAIIRDFTWASNNRILFNVTIPYYSKSDSQTFTLYRLGILDIEANSAMWPFTSDQFKYSIGAPKLNNKLVNDNNHILLSAYGKRDTLYQVDLTTGEKMPVFSQGSDGWLTDESGAVVLYQEYDKHQAKHLWFYRASNQREFLPLTYMDGDQPQLFLVDNIQGVSADRKTIYYFAKNAQSITVLMRATIANNRVGQQKELADFGRYDANTTIRDYNSSQLVGVSYVKNYPEYQYFDTDLAKVQADLKVTFPNAAVEITSYDLQRNRFIARISGALYPEQFFLYDRAGARLDKVGQGFPAVSTPMVGKVEPFAYQTSDHLEIVSYFTYPIAQSDKQPSLLVIPQGVNSSPYAARRLRERKPPLIVIPHGGPETRDDMSFDWMRQFFASQGFAVFQPNFRGSSGFGGNFAAAGYGQWGQRMQQDIDEGVEKLIELKMVDKNRICIVGASYGGYVAMYSATMRQELYQCAVSFAGVSDLDDMFYHAKQQKNNNNYWEKSIGKREDQAMLRRFSPLNKVTKSTLPILLFHGDKDTIVPTFQSKNMYKKLRRKKIRGSKYIELTDEDHWFSKGASRKKFLAEAIKFIQKYID